MAKLRTLTVAVPVECHNGHSATWFVKIKGLEVVEEGVPKEQWCSCPKWGLGEGYRATGDPYIIHEGETLEQRKSQEEEKEKGTPTGKGD